MSRANEWCEIAADRYMDERHRNWELAEEFGDVEFVLERGVVLVHRVRAEHIARALGVYPEAPAPAPPRPARMRLTRTSAPAPLPMVEPKATSRWRDVRGWLVILAGAAVFVAALTVPLGDPALVVALAMGLRGGRLVLDVDS
jgi:hypothetical protein